MIWAIRSGTRAADSCSSGRGVVRQKRMNLRAVLVVLAISGAVSGPALAQPADPFPPARPVPEQAPPQQPAPQQHGPTPQDPYGQGGQDPVLAEQIADQLVTRAQELFDAKIYVDAKQLAVEALVESPKGNAADRAHFIIKQVNEALGIHEDEPAPPLGPNDHPPDLTPMEDPTKLTKPAEPKAEPPTHDPRLPAQIHGAFYGGLIGATIGAYIDRDSPASGAVPIGALGGLAAGIAAPKLAAHYHANEAQVRTVGSAVLWGGVIGSMFSGTATGANNGYVHAPGVLMGGAIGSTVGLGAGIYYARQDELTRGDVALVDTFAGIGTVGGLTVGMLMQPAQAEAYSLNAALGAAAGVVVGLVAAPQTNTTPRRMLRVAGLAAAGGAVPMAILLAGPSDSGVQRAAGALSTVGLVAGAWLGFYLTRNMDVGLDVKDSAKPGADDAPPAVVGRDSDGKWHLGGLAIAPLSPQLATNQHGAALTVLGARF